MKVASYVEGVNFNKNTISRYVSKKILGAPLLQQAPQWENDETLETRRNVSRLFGT